MPDAPALDPAQRPLTSVSRPARHHRERSSKRASRASTRSTGSCTRTSISIATTRLRGAKAADLQRKAGLARGPLHGLPIALKDLLHIEGRADDRRLEIVARTHRDGNRQPRSSVCSPPA